MTIAASPVNLATEVKPFNPDQEWPTENSFLQGPYAPWTAESAAYDLEVIGELPTDLQGALFRTSSNPRFQPRSFERYHWFEGDGMVAGIYLRDGKAAFRTSWVKTDSFTFEVERGEAVYNGFVNGGSRGFIPDDAPQRRNVANTNVGVFDDHLLVYYENGLPYSMHPETLETLREWDFHGGIDVACTAHFKLDPKSGDMLFFAAVGNVVTWYRANALTGHVTDSHSFDVDIPIFLHDFAVSENYAAFFVTPTQFRADYVQQGRPGVVWDEKAVPSTHVMLLDRNTHRVTRHELGNTGAPTHFYNAYELGDDVIVHGHRTAAIGNPTDRLDRPLSGHEFFGPSFAWEWRINTRTGGLTERQLSDVPGDLPKINDLFLGANNRYGYFTTMRDSLVRHDHATDSTQLIAGAEGLVAPSEPVFVPRQNAQAEDDGYLLALWWDPATRLTDVLIHDAADPAAAPLARIKLPARIPAGFHGNWADQTALDKSVATLRTP